MQWQLHVRALSGGTAANSDWEVLVRRIEPTRTKLRTNPTRKSTTSTHQTVQTPESPYPKVDFNEVPPKATTNISIQYILALLISNFSTLPLTPKQHDSWPGRLQQVHHTVPWRNPFCDRPMYQGVCFKKTFARQGANPIAEGQSALEDHHIYGTVPYHYIYEDGC
jgi:hypothetical protein